MQLWRLQQKVHSSWLIAVMSLGVVVGTTIVPGMNQTYFASGAWLAVVAVLTALVFWRRAVYFVPVVLLTGMLFGLWRGSVLDVQLKVYENIYGHSAEVVGKVSDDPGVGRGGSLQLRLSELKIDGHGVDGKVWASVNNSHVEIKRGDFVSVSGVLEKGFGSFAGSIYGAKIIKVERPNPGDVARQVRDWFADKIRIGINEPEASLGLGYLLGQKRALPDDLAQALVVTGLTHVVVASGYNLTILVRLARRLFSRVSKYLSTLSATAMILGFMAVTGASPSMSRAGLVSSLSLAAWYYGRKFHPLVLLPFAAAITVLIDPTYAWNDLGWELSFAAFAGVMILAPLCQRYFFGNKKPGTIRQILGETISAQIATLPILILAFGQMSNVAIFANLMVLPLVPLAMLLTFVTGLSAIVFPGVAQLVGLSAQWLLTYMVEVVRYFASLPWAQMQIEINIWQAAAMYLVIIGLCVYLWRATGYSLRGENLVE